MTRVLARDGTVRGSIFTERRTVVTFAELPGHVKLAVLAAEDASFYEHQGLNYFGMLRALFANLRAHSTRQGASTITQQVVKTCCSRRSGLTNARSRRRSSPSASSKS